MIAISLLYAWRIVVLGMGAFTLGMVGYAILGYRRARRRPPAHVIGLLCSYALLLLALMIAILNRAFESAPITWRLPFASIAFPLGAWSMYALAREKTFVGEEEE